MGWNFSVQKGIHWLQSFTSHIILEFEIEFPLIIALLF